MVDMRAGMILILTLCSGCGRDTTPAADAAPVPLEAVAAGGAATPSDQAMALAFGHWKQESDRIKEYETHASSVGTNWMSVMAARTSRMHSIPNLKDSSIVLGVSLQTDAAFLQQPEPSDDMSIIEAGAFWKSYGAALQIAEQAFRDRGDVASAEKILAHRNAVFR
jgi:hypothetical protein